MVKSWIIHSAITLLLLILLTPSVAEAAVCSAAEVQAAVTAASNGGTVTLTSSCTSTWASGISIPDTKGITLDGNGAVITSGYAGFLISVSTNTTTRSRVTGFTFLALTTTNKGVIQSGPTTNAVFRIDHNTFTGGTNNTQLEFDGNGPALADHNTFNCGDATTCIRTAGYYDTTSSTSWDLPGWNDDTDPGGPGAVYIEDNTFHKNDCGSPCNYFSTSALASYYGSRTVFRYNTLDVVQIDQHGTDGAVGARWWEFYNNTWAGPADVGSMFYADIRAGSGLVFNNIHTGSLPADSGAHIYFEEEDSGYPAAYQIGRGKSGVLYPAYVWGNDSALDPVVLGSPMVILDRDVYSSVTAGCASGGACTSGVGSGTALPTTCTAGVGFWKTDAGGNWDTTHGGANDGALYKCTSTDTWTLSYTPYTYPHPAQDAEVPVLRGRSNMFTLFVLLLLSLFLSRAALVDVSSKEFGYERVKHSQQFVDVSNQPLGYSDDDVSSVRTANNSENNSASL